MDFPYLLFDADNTLFDFDAAERNAHQILCRKHGLAFSEEGYQFYHQCNAQLWQDFDRGLCTKEFLLVERFRRYLTATGEHADPQALSADHLLALSESTALLPACQPLPVKAHARAPSFFCSLYSDSCQKTSLIILLSLLSVHHLYTFPRLIRWGICETNMVHLHTV